MGNWRLDSLFDIGNNLLKNEFIQLPYEFFAFLKLNSFSNELFSVRSN